MTVKELIKALIEFPQELPVVDYAGDEISIVRLNDDPHWDVAGDVYDGHPFVNESGFYETDWNERRN